MEIGLGNTNYQDFIHAEFWYFEIKCFSGDTPISGFSSPKLQYIAYVAHPLSRIVKDLLESGNRYQETPSQVRGNKVYVPLTAKNRGSTKNKQFEVTKKRLQ